jgi:hypothetical protein
MAKIKVGYRRGAGRKGFHGVRVVDDPTSSWWRRSTRHAGIDFHQLGVPQSATWPRLGDALAEAGPRSRSTSPWSTRPARTSRCAPTPCTRSCTTGFSHHDLERFERSSPRPAQHRRRLNFAIGAVLMMRFCEPPPYFETAEVIEFHHDEKLDASGTRCSRSSAWRLRRLGARPHHEDGGGRRVARSG